MSQFFKTFLVTPLYHLLIAGPSQQCMRLPFFMAIIWLLVLTEIVVKAINGAVVFLLNTMGFPSAAAGHTYCHWSMILNAAKPPLQQHVQQFVTNNASTIDTVFRSVGVLGLGLAMFLGWRVLMLVIQRANNTRLSATVLVCATLVLWLAHYFDPWAAPSDSFFQFAFVAWLAFLAFFPPHETVPFKPQSQNAGMNFISKAMYHAFAAPINEKASPLTFLLGMALIYIVPLIFLAILVFWGWFHIVVAGITQQFNIDQVLCMAAVIDNSQDIPEKNYVLHLALYAAGAMPLTSLLGPLLLLSPLIYLYVAIRWYMMCVQRFRYIHYSYPTVWAAATFILLSLCIVVFAYKNVDNLYTWVMMIGAGVIVAFLPPLNRSPA